MKIFLEVAKKVGLDMSGFFRLMASAKQCQSKATLLFASFTFIFCFLLFSVVTAQAQIINNTASMGYASSNNAVALQLQSTVKVQVLGAQYDQASLTIQAVVAQTCIVNGGIANLTMNVANTGTNPLTQAVVEVSPPINGTLSGQSLTGQYTVTQLVGGGLRIALDQALAVAGSITIPAVLQFANPLTTSQSITAVLSANAINNIAVQSNAFVVQARTASSIQFMALDTSVQPATLLAAQVYHANDDVWLQVQDVDQNIDPYAVETIIVTLTDDITRDSETFTLTETAINSGQYTGMVPSVVGVAVVHNDGKISVSGASELKASYIDRCDGTDTTAAATLVDPFGKVFSTSDGSPVDGATVTIMDLATGQPALILGDDGFSTYPSTVTTGGTATDAAGTVYNFPAGGYRFPFALPGSYYFLIQVPAGFSYPTILTDSTIQTIAGAPFALTVGSRGEVFRINPGPAMHIDVPVDTHGSALFVRKSAGSTQVSIGDFVSYNLKVENTNPNFPATTVHVVDQMPQGFHYQTGSTVIDGYSVADPLISSDGRTLQFDIYTIAASATAQINYILQIGVGTRFGEATNRASASSISIGQHVTSNTALATVLVGDDLMAAKSLIVGRVYVDENDNGLNDPGELGLSGIRVFMQDGTFIATDKDGHFHIEDIDPGTHVLQMDDVPERYEPAPLPNTRFAGNRVSQFVDAVPGAIVRANFRVLNRAPPQTPVHIVQELSREQQDVWVDLHISHDGTLPLKKYMAVYSAPDGWQLDQASATLDGKTRTPDASMIGYLWPLSAAKQAQHIRFRILPLTTRLDGEKESVAYVRFSTAGTPKGRTGMAKVTLLDSSTETRISRAFEMRVHFDTLVAALAEEDRATLDTIIEDLHGLKVRKLHVVGHTDNVRIAVNHRDIYADNWALSKARAATIADYLHQKLVLEEGASSSEGKADSEPISSNDVAEGRAKNRRTQLFIDAVKIERATSIELVTVRDQAEAKAIGTWDKQRTVTQAVPAAAPPKKEEVDGILSLKDGQGVPYRINAVRLQLDSRYKLKLLVDGKQVSNDRIGFRSIDPNTDKTLYTFIGVDLGDPGEHIVRIEGTGPFGNVRFKQEVRYIRTGEIAFIRFIESGRNIADGKTPVRVRVLLLDDNGEVIRARTEIEVRGGDLLAAPRSELYQTEEEANAAVLKTVMVDRDGWMNFKPTGVSGTHRIEVGYNDVQRSIEVFLSPEYRDWIMVGLAEGKMGWQQLSGNVEPVDKQVWADRYYRDGKLAFYTKGQIKGEYLLTMAYDSSKTDGANKNRLQQFINPTSYYTLYGDSTLRQSDAASKEKLYIKLERNTFYAMYGDYDTGLSITELGRYSRSLNGFKSELKNEKYGYTLFASRTSQSYIKDELRGNGTSGLYRLSRKNIISGSEKLRVEIRDRLRSEVILNSVQMQRFADYDIDYQAGTIYFKSPVNAYDFSSNPIYIRVEYESNDSKDQFLNAGARATVKPMEGLEIGSTYVQEGQLYHHNRLMAADATLDLGSSTEIRAELARTSAGATPQSVLQGDAYKLEVKHLGKKFSGNAYVRELQGGFGMGQQLGSESGTRKYGGDIRYKLTDQFSVSSAATRQQALSTGNINDSLNNQLTWKRKAQALGVGLTTARDLLANGDKNLSRLLTANASSQIGNRLTVQASREQALGAGVNSSNYPTRTTAGATYMLSEKVALDIAQDWTQGAKQNSSSTRVGLKSSPWSGGQLFTRYEQSLDESGVRSFANMGLKQQWTVTKKWRVDLGLDRVQTLKHPGAYSTNPNAPLASGGGNDFTAFSLGANYSPEGLRWTNRLEHRVSKTGRSWGVSSAVQGEPKDALSLSLGTRVTHSRENAGTFQTAATTSLGLALRPDYDGLILFDRLDVRYTASDNLVTKNLAWDYINNLHANWQYDVKNQLEFHHGIKWTRQNIDQRAFTAITDFIFARWRYDLAADWDVSLQAAMMHGWRSGQFISSFGPAIGHNVMDDMWVSVGYNGQGFNARDFATAGYTTRGVYVDFRMKFDQNNIKRWLAFESRPKTEVTRNK